MEYESKSGNVYISRNYRSFFIIYPTLHPNRMVPPQPGGDPVHDIPETGVSRPPHYVRYQGKRTILVFTAQRNIFLVYNPHRYYSYPICYLWNNHAHSELGISGLHMVICPGCVYSWRYFKNKVLQIFRKNKSQLNILFWWDMKISLSLVILIITSFYDTLKVRHKIFPFLTFRVNLPSKDKMWYRVANSVTSRESRY